jgi:hypothetical protein
MGEEQRKVTELARRISDAIGPKMPRNDVYNAVAVILAIGLQDLRPLERVAFFADLRNLVEANIAEFEKVSRNLH